VTAVAERPKVAVEPERPLGSYATLMVAFSTIFGGAIAVAGARNRLPERPSLVDVALVGVAAHKLARLVAKDKVTAPLRAPVTETITDDDGEPTDEPTGTGMRRAFGELITCPKCVGQWACAAFVTGLIYSPRPTRVVASVFAADAISDFSTPRTAPRTRPERRVSPRVPARPTRAAAAPAATRSRGLRRG
jgi:hypothetical protein